MKYNYKVNTNLGIIIKTIMFFLFISFIITSIMFFIKDFNSNLNKDYEKVKYDIKSFDECIKTDKNINSLFLNYKNRKIIINLEEFTTIKFLIEKNEEDKRVSFIEKINFFIKMTKIKGENTIVEKHSCKIN